MDGGQSEDTTGDGLLDSLDEFLEANRSLQRVLWASEARTEAYVARLRAGERVIDIARAEAVGTARTEDNEALDRLTRARQRSRTATFRRLSSEGMSRREIADHWGFSQQMVSRILSHPSLSPPEESGKAPDLPQP